MQNSRSSGFSNHSSTSSVVEHSLVVVVLARPLVDAVQRRDRDLASQLRRAISSIALNLAEGFGVTGGNGRIRFETALGSLNEAKTAIRVAIAWGYFPEQSAAAVLESLGVLGGRVVGLVKR
jgi:four helix bundle protein